MIIAYIYLLQLNRLFKILLIALLGLTNSISSQSLPFKENARWGIKDGNKVIINPTYDSIFNFDETGKVCLACRKMKGPSNKIIKVTTFTYACHYLNKKGEKLRIKAGNNDTCSIFSLGKNTVTQFSDAHTTFVVGVKGLKYMVDKKGDKTSVLVPIRTWEKINQEYTKLQNKLKVFTGIKEGLSEVKEAKKSGKKLQTLKDFLRESNS